jgi:hypothetical protein
LINYGGIEMKYRKKPVVIDAVQFTGKNLDEILEFGAHAFYNNTPGKILIPTLEGRMTANKGDYIIKGVKGEFYPCKPDIFEATYEEA